MVIENKAREAERIVSQLVDEAERRKEEARELQREVASARYIIKSYISTYYMYYLKIFGFAFYSCLKSSHLYALNFAHRV